MSHFTQIVRYANIASLPAVGEISRIYITDDTRYIYLWNGSSYQTATTPEIIDGSVATYADLPTAADHNGEIWLVTTTTGIIGINRKVAGFYTSNGSAWTLITPVDIDGYQKLITSPTNGDIVTTDATGQGQDSGKKFNDSGSSSNDIWSASKIQGLLDTKAGETLNESKGFYDRTEFNLSWSNATRTITITRTGSSFSFYVNNVKVTKNSDDLKQISNTEGLHFIYYDLNGILQDTTTWNDDIIIKYVPVCFVYWDATNGVSVPDAQIETHTANNFSGIIHLQQHRSVGTRYQSGLDLSVNADGDGSNNNQIEVAGASGTIWDEDLQHSIPSRALTDNIPVLYRSGASGLWRMDASLPYIVRTTGTGRAAYNQYTAGAWQLTEITNNNFGIAYVYVCPSITNKWIVVMGQDQYNNLNLARDAAKIAPSLGVLPLQEFKLVGSIIFQTSNSYTNAAKSIIVTIDGINPYVDWTATNAAANNATVNNSDIVYLQSQIDLKANDSAVVHNTGDETISGIKTFNDSPLVPKATTGDNTTKAASTSFVTTADNNVKLFVSDNYQNLTGLDTSSGYVGLTGYSINFKDTTGARKSLLTNSNTVARTYTFQDKDGTIADLADVALKAPLASPTFTGTVTVPTPSNATDAATKDYVDNASSNAAVIAKLLTGFSAAAGTVAATDSIIQAFNKIVGNLNALSSPLVGFHMIYTNSTQQISDNTDISWTGRTDYFGLGSQISFSGASIIFASGYKYIVLCSMSAVLYTDPAYKLTWSMRTGGSNVGADGILWSNPNGSTSDLGIGGTILGGVYINTSGGSAIYQLRKLTSGAGSSSPTCQGQIIVIAFT